jgi:hypothetical protein
MLENVGTFDSRAIAAKASARYSLDVVGDRLSGVYEAVLAEFAVGAPAPRATSL